MKRFTDYSNTELAALDEDGIQRLIDIELAVDGVIPVPQPQSFTMQAAGLEKKDQAFQVGGMIFRKREDAEKVAVMELLTQGYDYSGAGYDYNWLTPAEVKVETVAYYLEADVRAAAAQLREFSKRKDQYDKEVSAWDKYQKRVSSIREEVWAAIWAARDEQCKIDTAFQTLNKYRDLADGDEAVAENFFKNTYKDQPDLIEAVLGPQETVSALTEAEIAN